MKKNLIYIGTSGWSYRHWDKVFYPEDLKAADHLPFYTNYFSTVEVNTTFYRLPAETMVKNWVLRTPKDFIFSVKANGYITHRKRLIDPEESLERFYDSIKPLVKKLGPILFQLPPSFKKDEERLKTFISYLKPNFKYVFEFRHDTWYCDSVYDCLNESNIALCITDLKGHLSPLEITADFVYLRLHGPTKKAYSDSYPEKTLKDWQKRFLEWDKQGLNIYSYFDNDEKGYAVRDALRLKKFLEK